jgi:hypothetical protein
MSAKQLATVTNDVITSYGNTAKNVIQAYRAGGERVVVLLEQGWNRALKQSRPQLTAEVASNASAAKQAVRGYYIKGLDLSADTALGAVQQVVKFAGAGVNRVAANAQQFEDKTGLHALNKLAQASLPGAMVLCTLADKLETGSAKLVSKVAGEPVVLAAAKRRVSKLRKTRILKTA